MPKALFVVFLCGQSATCQDGKQPVDCHPVAVFHAFEHALKWQQQRCAEWRLPDCDAQPAPERLPLCDADPEPPQPPSGVFDNLRLTP